MAGEKSGGQQQPFTQKAASAVGVYCCSCDRELRRICPRAFFLIESEKWQLNNNQKNQRNNINMSDNIETDEEESAAANGGPVEEESEEAITGDTLFPLDKHPDQMTPAELLAEVKVRRIFNIIDTLAIKISRLTK